MLLSMLEKRRVLIFSLAYLPFVGGAELALKEITDRIADIEFDLITLRLDRNLPKEEKIGKVRVHRVGFGKRNPSMAELTRFPMYLNKILFPPIAFAKAVRLHRRCSFNAVWAMMAYAGFPAVFFKRRFPKVPFVLTLQEGDSIAHITKRLRIRAVFPVLKQVFMKADVIQVISRYLADFAREMGARAPVEIIPNGVDIPKFEFRNLKSEIEQLKRTLGIRESDRVVITVSRLVPKNAVGDIINAMQYLPPDVKLLVVGAGPLEQELKLKAKSYKLQARTIFAGEVVPDRVPQYLAIADVFVRPSLSEGMGSAFVEAMAVGVPVVATPVGGIVDFLIDTETGLLCKVQDSKNIAEKVSLLLKNKELRERVIKNAKKMVEEEYNWDIIAKDMRSRVFGKYI